MLMTIIIIRLHNIYNVLIAATRQNQQKWVNIRPMKTLPSSRQRVCPSSRRGCVRQITDLTDLPSHYPPLCYWDRPLTNLTDLPSEYPPFGYWDHQPAVCTTTKRRRPTIQPWTSQRVQKFRAGRN